MIYQRKKRRLILILLCAGLSIPTTATHAQLQAEVDCMMAVMRSCSWRLCRGDINCLDDDKTARCSRHSEFTCMGPGKDPAAIAAREDAWLTQAIAEASRLTRAGGTTDRSEPTQPEPRKPPPVYARMPEAPQTPASPGDTANVVEPWNTVMDEPCGSVSFEANKYDCPEGYPQYILQTSNACPVPISWRGAYYGSNGRAVEVLLAVPPGVTQAHTPCCNGPYHKHLQCLDSAQGVFE